MGTLKRWGKEPYRERNPKYFCCPSKNTHFQTVNKMKSKHLEKDNITEGLLILNVQLRTQYLELSLMALVQESHGQKWGEPNGTFLGKYDNWAKDFPEKRLWKQPMETEKRSPEDIASGDPAEDGKAEQMSDSYMEKPALSLNNAQRDVLYAMVIRKIGTCDHWRETPLCQNW